MTKSVMKLLAVLLLAGWLGTLVTKDPGYVLISYAGASLQTGIWVFLVLTLLAVGVFYAFLRLLVSMLGVGEKLRVWGNVRRRRKAYELTQRGLVYMQEGDLIRAEKFLISGAALHEMPVVNFINAAKAADARNDPEQRETYLRQAREADASASAAVTFAAAEMAAKRQDWQFCLDQLVGLKENQLVIMLKQEAFEALEKWDQFAKLWPKFVKYTRLSESQLNTLENKVLIARMSNLGSESDHAIADNSISNNERLRDIYQQASESSKIDPAVVKSFCNFVDDEKLAEATLRRVLKKAWSGQLLEIYALLGKETLNRRIKNAEGWLKSHPADGYLYHCLGLLYVQLDDRPKAKQAFEQSVNNGNPPGASRCLAGQLAFDGDYEQSNEYLRLELEALTGRPESF